MQHEGFAVPALGVVREGEDGGAHEAEERVYRAVVGITEAAHLIARVHEPASRVHEQTEHADFRVHVAKMRDLEDLRAALEGRESSAAEEPLARVDAMTVLAGQHSVGRGIEKEIPPLRGRGGQLIVEGADRIRRQDQREREVGEALHVAARKRSLAPQQSVEGDDEVAEGLVLVVGRGAEEAVAAVSAPVHRTAVLHAAERLGRHRALHRVEDVGLTDAVQSRRRDRRLKLDQHRIVGQHVVGIAEIPPDMVHVPEDMTRGARGFAVARADSRVVEEGATIDDGGRLLIRELPMLELELARQVDHRDAVVEARVDEESLIGLVENEAGRSSARHVDVAAGERLGIEGVGFESRGREYADAARAEGRDEERRAVAGDGHFEGRRQAVILLRGIESGIPGERAVVDVFVQVAREDARAVDQRNPRLGEMALDGRGAGDPGALELGQVLRVRIRDIELSGDGVDGHVEERRPHARMGACLGEGRRIELEDVEIGQVEAHEGAEPRPGIPDATQHVAPLTVRSLLRDQPHFRSLETLDVLRRSGDPSRRGEGTRDQTARRLTEPIANEAIIDLGRPVARVMDPDEDLAAIGRARERTGRVAEEGHDADRGPAECRAEVRRVEDPDVGAADAFGRELRLARAGDGGDRGVRAVLAAVGRRDEGAAVAGTGKQDVARLVADQ